MDKPEKGQIERTADQQGRGKKKQQRKNSIHRM